MKTYRGLAHVVYYFWSDAHVGIIFGVTYVI
jgi:hypothetical protein